MILHRLLHHGSHAFPREIAVDFDALPTVVAVTGPNGAGKTSLMDLLMLPFLGECAYRPGAVHRNFVTKGAVDLTWSQDGTRYRSVLKVDPDLERTEASLLTPDGALLAGPLIRDYRKRLAELVGPPEWLLASAYAVQNGVGAFLSLPRPARKALLSDLLGLQRFGRLEEATKAHGREAETRLATIRGRITELEGRATVGATLQAEHAAASQALADATAQLERAAESVQRAQAGKAAADTTLATLLPLRTERQTVTAQRTTLQARRTDLEQRRAANEALLSRRPEIDAATTRAEALRQAIAAADTTIETATALVRQRDGVRSQATLAEKDLTAAERRVEDLTARAGMAETVPCQAKGKYAACPFLADVRTATTERATATTRVQALRSALVGIAAEIATWSDHPEISLSDAQAARQACRHELDGLSATLALAPRLEAATARLEELTGQLGTCDADAARAQARLAALDQALVDSLTADEAVRAAQRTVNEAEASRLRAQQDVTRWTQTLGRLEGQLAACAQAEADRVALLAQGPGLEADVADWAWLARAFGPTGLPALLIDQACPELSVLATDLLRETWGEQAFGIALVTQRESAAGDKLLETLDVRLSRGGEALDAALLSGGERVLVTEALGLALALFAAGRGGHALGVLLRDEVAAPLDVERAPAYVAMLRRAAVIGGLRTVAFVSHNERAVALADAVLEVRDGTVTVG